MSKISKKSLLAVVLTLILALCLGAFAACNNDTPSGNELTYTVTVTTVEGDPAAGVKVTIKKGSATFETATTDNQGKVTFKLAEDSYDVALANLPEHYEVSASDSLKLTKDHADLTVTLVQKFAYKVYLVDEDEQPFYADGVEVGVCTASNCLPTVALDNTGLATIEAAKGDYHVQIVNLPAGYTYRSDANGYYTGKEFSATETEMSIMIYRVESFDIVNGTAMTAAEKTKFIEDNYFYGMDAEATAYKYTAENPAHSVKYFSIKPALTGKYMFYKAGGAADYFDGETFNAACSGTYAGQYKILNANTTYYFALGNATEDAVTTDFVIVLPYSSYTVYTGVGGTIQVTVGKANTNAIIEYTPTASGIYTATTQGDALTIVSGGIYEPSAVLDETPADGDYAKGSTYSVNVNDRAVKSNTTVYFAVTAKTAGTVSVELKRTGDTPDKYSYAQVKGTLTQYTKTEGTELYGVPMDGSVEIVYSEEDGYYHVGDKDGKVVVVLLTEGLDSSRYEDGSVLAYIDMNPLTNAQYVFNKAAAGEPKDEVDYTVFLRGFEKYEDGPSGTLIIPEEITTEVYYAKYVNEDGAYPLTKELKEFLDLFVENNTELLFWQLPMDMAEGCDWMFPLYYYDVATEADPICGEYKFVSRVYTEDEESKTLAVGDEVEELDMETWEPTTRTIGDNEYKLVINKNHTFVIYERFNDEEYDIKVNGTWEYDEEWEAYFFIQPNGLWNDRLSMYLDVEFSVEITEETITLTGDDDSEWVFQIPAPAAE